MARLGHFALQFEMLEGIRNIATPLMSGGYWLSPAQDEYSVAVVPVMWPSSPPADLDPTGSGDMTFGAFFLLGGV